MKFLLDTNVISETMKPRPDAGAVAWLASLDDESAFLSVITMAELRRGTERMPPGARRSRLERWLSHDIPLRFEGRILPVGVEVADLCGRVIARCESRGRPIDYTDALLSATALGNGLTLATRDVTDVECTGVLIFNPWHT